MNVLLLTAAVISGYPFLQAFLRPPSAEGLGFVVTVAPPPATVTAIGPSFGHELLPA